MEEERKDEGADGTFVSEEHSCKEKGGKKREECPKTVVAIADFFARDETQLSFNEGDELVILSEQSVDWWWGELEGVRGYVPVAYLTSEAEYVKHFTSNHEWQDEEYFGDYGKLKLHLEMLGDEPRTLAYSKAINRHRDFFLGKTVLDVGSGTGILSMFCARDGQANKVYAVEASVEIGDLTTEIIEVNNLSEKISVFIGKIEDVELPEKVDIVLSEWMGTFLLFEFMIDSVLFARDTWLKPGGIIWPSNAKLFIAPCSAKKVYDEKVTVWNNQYGFDFTPVLGRAKTEFLDRPLHNYELCKEDCLSQAAVLLDINMQTFSRESLEFMSEQFEFVIIKDGTLHGFCTWFSVLFGGVPLTDKSAYDALSTGPDHQRTHWKQNLFLLDDPVVVYSGNFISGSAILRRNPQYRRHLNVTFDFKIFSAKLKGSVIFNMKKKFFIWR